jgi:beta-mannosidase
MKQIIVLSNGWTLKDCDTQKEYAVPKMPMQVHTILQEHGTISDGYIYGDTADCRWVQEHEWMYTAGFTCEDCGKKAFISAKGLDTFADVYLNDVLIGSHEDFYLSARFDVTGKLLQTNTLRILFHSVPEILREYASKNPHPDRIEPYRMIRKNFHDFITYLGAKPDLMKVGIFADVALELVDTAEIKDFTVDYVLNDALTSAEISIKAETTAACDLKIRVSGQQTERCYTVKSSGNGTADIKFSIENPSLWYPRGYGKQPLYSFRAEALSDEGALFDISERMIGFRKVVMVNNLDFEINQIPVKLWGANLTPVDGKTACTDRERLMRIFELAYDCNINTIRIWGEGERYDDEFYDEADRKGVLIWQEFFSGNSAYPNDSHLRSLLRLEAEELVLRLRHHPSLLLWCGGNETYLNRDFGYPGEEYYGSEIVENDYREVCAKLDSGRYYHVTSPCGGAYSNDPSSGDTHSYTNTWFVPGGDYPNFVSENLRVALPVSHSLMRYLRLDEKPSVTSLMQDGSDYPWPEEWNAITSADSWYKIPPIEQFYDAADFDSMVYRFGAAAGAYLRDSVERYRRGKPVWDSQGRRRCQGHLVWKLNTTRPHIYSSIIDYYLEPGIPYYALKRAYEPVLVSFEISDHIYAWIVNDSTETVEGSLILQLFDIASSKVEKEFTVPVRVKAGQSQVVSSLDEFGQFLRKRLIVGRLVKPDRTPVLTVSSFADIERHLSFPDANLTLSSAGNELIVETDRFARCVELSGEKAGDLFGFYFTDNYFDLLPGEKKHIGIKSRHSGGKITAKAHWSKAETIIQI